MVRPLTLTSPVSVTPPHAGWSQAPLSSVMPHPPLGQQLIVNGVVTFEHGDFSGETSGTCPAAAADRVDRAACTIRRSSHLIAHVGAGSAAGSADQAGARLDDERGGRGDEVGAEVVGD